MHWHIQEGCSRYAPSKSPNSFVPITNFMSWRPPTRLVIPLYWKSWIRHWNVINFLQRMKMLRTNISVAQPGFLVGLEAFPTNGIPRALFRRKYKLKWKIFWYVGPYLDPPITLTAIGIQIALVWKESSLFSFFAFFLSFFSSSPCLFLPFSFLNDLKIVVWTFSLVHVLWWSVSHVL